MTGGWTMKWTKPEAEVVAVTMEVTAYVATL
jgi:coenzyme PQQ precursor peptide PqqA